MSEEHGCKSHHHPWKGGWNKEEWKKRWQEHHGHHHKCSENGEDDCDRDDHGGGCCHLMVAATLLGLKAYVVANGTQAEADSCGVGYVFDYIYKTLFVQAVTTAVVFLGCCCWKMKRDYEKREAKGCTNCACGLTDLAGFGAYIAGLVFLATLWHNYPTETLMFFPEFYTNPTNCGGGIDSKVYDIANGVLKFDSFMLMLGFLFFGLGCFCCIMCLPCMIKAKPWKKGCKNESSGNKESVDANEATAEDLSGGPIVAKLV